MLDDVFSGLDAISEDRIFSQLLGNNGLLRRLRTTAILVTHAAHRLSYADHVIALSPTGTISEQGKFGDLVTSNGYVGRLAARHIIETDAEPKDGPASPKTMDDNTARINAAADLHRPIGNWAVYNYYFTSVGRRNVVVWMCLMISYSLLLNFPGKVIQSIFERMLNIKRYLDQILDERHCCSRQLCQRSLSWHTCCSRVCCHGHTHDFNWYALYHYDTTFSNLPP